MQNAVSTTHLRKVSGSDPRLFTVLHNMSSHGEDIQRENTVGFGMTVHIWRPAGFAMPQAEEDVEERLAV